MQGCFLLLFIWLSIIEKNETKLTKSIQQKKISQLNTLNLNYNYKNFHLIGKGMCTFAHPSFKLTTFLNRMLNISLNVIYIYMHDLNLIESLHQFVDFPLPTIQCCHPKISTPSNPTHHNFRVTKSTQRLDITGDWKVKHHPKTQHLRSIVGADTTSHHQVEKG